MTIIYINPTHMPHLKHDITLPPIKIDTVHNYLTFTNTWRDGGMRLQEQNINDKQVFHNYGQGMAEVSLAYGSAYLVSKMITLKKENYKIKKVAVLGSGVNALMTTLELVKRGHQVTLYTESVPKKGDSGQSEGLQFWYPGDYDNCDPLKHELVSKLSYEFLAECIHTNRYQSLSWANLYAAGLRSEQIRDNVTDFVTKDIGQASVNFSNLRAQEYNFLKTILIDTELLTQQLYTEIRLRNTSIITQKFTSIDDILKLKQQFVYNCLGPEIKHIFGDAAVSAVNRFYIPFELANPINQSYAIWRSSEIAEQEDFVIVVSGRKLQISSRNRVSAQQVKKAKDEVLSRAYHFWKERKTNPSKL